MKTKKIWGIATGIVVVAFAASRSSCAQQPVVTAEQLTAMKQQAIAGVDRQAKQVQVMVDTVFSFGELGYQEYKTSKYLSGILEQNGFKVERGIAGIPTAWMATWGEGKPVIALGSDLDCIPQASQKPGVAYHDPIVSGAPGHGEGHNSGEPLNIIAALAVKDLMVKNHLKGTIKIWPGIAEELLGSKAFYVREGYFKDMDAVLFTHVGNSLGTNWGGGISDGLISVQYNFLGESAHAAVAPWRGRSALDAVELMDVGWNFRREHLRLEQRSHYVITNGGDQPNVVPSNASVWYYFREADYDHIRGLWDAGDKMAQGASLMTQTTWNSQVLGAAWPGHFNKALAEDAFENVKQVGMPTWSDDDQKLAKALQHEIHALETGLKTELPELGPPPDPPLNLGVSDDIGDVSWVVPTIILGYPSNIPGLPGHNWANGVSMATPIAYKGVIAGAKVQAMTVLDLLTKPDVLKAAWDYFDNVQTKNEKYRPLLRPEDKPALWLNKVTMEKYRPEMEKYYYDAAKYPTYMDQLGLHYPTIRTADQKSSNASEESEDSVALAASSGK
jgi:aminobenzoyl-glutamate utilization protein B